ncbi:MAG: hypothetical protein WC886_06275 [Saccharofermentanaceae bacterium]|jgi:hypothetical protein
MESQKTFDCYGRELTDAAAALLNFEKNNAKEIAGIVAEHEGLTEKAERMAAKLNEEKVELEKRLGIFHAGLSAAESKIRADMIATMGTPGKKTTHLDGDGFEQAIIGKIEKQARGILGLRGRALDILKMERDLVAVKLQASGLSQRPFFMRQQVAAEFFRALTSVSGMGVKINYGSPAFGETNRFDKELKRLDEHIAIAEGTAAHFDTVGHAFTFVDGSLELALSIPEKYFPQLLEAWTAMKIAGVKKGGVSLDQTGTISWRGPRPESASEAIVTRQLHRGISGTANPPRARV